MSNSKKPNILLLLAVTVAVAAGLIWAMGQSHNGKDKPKVESVSKNMTAPEREALEVAQNVDDLKSLKSSMNLMQKKNEVRTWVDVAIMSKGKTMDQAAFENAWKKIMNLKQQNQSVEELAAGIEAEIGK
jgi:hypothetical protein